MRKTPITKEFEGYESGSPGGFLKYLLLLIVTRIGLGQAALDMKLVDYAGKVAENIHLESKDSPQQIADKIARAERGRGNLRQLLTKSKSLTFDKLIEALRVLGAQRIDLTITVHWEGGRSETVTSSANVGSMRSSVDGETSTHPGDA